MKEEEKEDIRGKILDNIAQIEDELEAIKPKLYPLKKDCSIDKVEHKALKLEQNIAIQRFEEAKKRKNRLLFALHEIDNNQNFGLCKECEEEILIDRLKIVPESIYCVECQNELQKNR